MKSHACQTWIASWWPNEAIGGKAGREIYDGLFPFIDAAAAGKYIISLDFSLAFDFCDPAIVLPFLRDLGLPAPIGQMLLTQWSNQLRYLTFENFALPVPEKVSKSLPQGDPWSMLGMVALLTPAIWEIPRKHPNVLHRTFVDDSSWAADTVHEARAVEALWKSWSSILQLQENNAKSQYFHARESGRQNFIDSGVLASQVSHDVVILGYAFRGFRQRKLTRNEDDRVNTSVALIRKATYLPVSYSMKKRIIAAAPIAKVEFGWLMKVPPLVVCAKVQKAIKLALHEPQNSSPDLRDLLRGHRLNMNFRIAPHCIGAVRRCLQKIPADTLYPWHQSFGVGASLTSFLQRFSWSYHSPWVWRHDLTRKFFALDKTHVSFEPFSTARKDDLTSHKLRESFRAHCFQSWKYSGRNDAAHCENIRFSEDRCKLAMNLAEDSRHNFAILTGAFVSDASLATRKRLPVHNCSFCSHGAADTDHAFWNCRTFPPPIPRPHDTLLRRLGWPRVGHPTDNNIVSWMYSVRQRTLARRYQQ